MKRGRNTDRPHRVPSFTLSTYQSRVTSRVSGSGSDRSDGWTPLFRVLTRGTKLREGRRRGLEPKPLLLNFVCRTLPDSVDTFQDPFLDIGHRLSFSVLSVIVNRSSCPLGDGTELSHPRL